jgi:hypothetical protein
MVTIVRLCLRTGYQVRTLDYQLYLTLIPDVDTFLDIPDLEINPYESLSQYLSYSIGSTAADSSIVSYASEAL